MTTRNGRWLLWAPLGVFLLLLALASSRLMQPTQPDIRSRLLGKPLPALALAAIVPEHPGLRVDDRGPRLVNIFASWCVPCAAEVEQLARLKARGVVVDGIAVRDTPEDLRAFLERFGDPYRAIGGDPDSRSMIALGSTGVPESFIVDRAGIIRYQHVGAIGAQDFADILRAWEAAS